MIAQRFAFSCPMSALSFWSSSCPWYKAVMIPLMWLWLDWYLLK